MKIEIWSDVACPWCYIGKRRFESALAHFVHREQVEVTWRSYQLDPGAPRDPGQSVNEILALIHFRIADSRPAFLGRHLAHRHLAGGDVSSTKTRNQQEKAHQNFKGERAPTTS